MCSNLEQGVILYTCSSILMGFFSALLTFVNAWNVKMAARVQDVFTITKVLALVVIIITGIVYLFIGKLPPISYTIAFVVTIIIGIVYLFVGKLAPISRNQDMLFRTNVICWVLK